MTRSLSSNYHVASNNGFGYLVAGFKMLREKQLRALVLMPLLVNILLFGLALYFLIEQLDYWMQMLTSWLPSFLQWLSYILWPISLLTILVIFSFVFTAGANLVASPFNALLSERLVALMNNEPVTNDNTITKEVVRMLAREWQKLRYSLPKFILFGLLLFVPVVGALIWFLFIAWVLAIQYIDYPFDNAQQSFNEMKSQLNKKKPLTFSFGIAVSLFSSLPLINLLVMPAAVCGATLLWLEHYQQDGTE